MREKRGMEGIIRKLKRKMNLGKRDNDDETDQ
jgi:hypothetical protein